MNKLFLLILVLPALIFSQVNTEKLRKEINETGFFGSIGLSGTFRSGNSEYVSVKGDFRTDFVTHNSDYFLVSNYEFKKGNSKKIINKGFSHLRGIWDLSSRTEIEAFLQKEFNEFILLNDRNLIGTGLRFDVIKWLSNIENETDVKIYLGFGAMFENEDYSLKIEPESNLIRATNYLTFNWRISESTEFQTVIYYQPAFNDFNDYRFLTDAGINFSIIKNLFFTTSLNYRFDNDPLPGLKKYDVEVSNGITFQF